MIPSLDTSQPVCPATPVTAHWACEPSGHGGRDDGYIQIQQNGLLLTKTDLDMVTTEYPVCQHQRPTLSPNIVPLSRGNQPASQ